MKAVIIGATGLVGSSLLQKLLKDPAIERIVSVVRRKSSVTDPKLREVVFKEFTDLPQLANELNGDLYYCCLGTTIKKAQNQENFRKVDHEGVLEFGKIAKDKSAKAFVLVSAAGANEKSNIFYNKVKGQTEKDLMDLGLNHLVIMRPSLLIGEREENRPAEKIAIKAFKLLRPVLPKSIAVRAGTEVEVLAEKMLRESKKENRGVKFFGPAEIRA